MKTEVSQSRNGIVVVLRHRKLSNSLSPVLLGCFSREISAASKDGKGLTKRLNGGSNGEVIRRCDVDEKVEDFVDAVAGQVFSIDGFNENVLPLCEVEANSVVVVRKGRMVSKSRIPRRGRGGATDDVADLMKRDGGFHLSKIEVERRRTKSKVEVM